MNIKITCINNLFKFNILIIYEPSFINHTESNKSLLKQQKILNQHISIRNIKNNKIK